MRKKVIYLLIALCLPAVIFIFLKYFGENQFDIPVYYQDGIPSSQLCGLTTSTKPYTVPDSVMEGFQTNQVSAVLITFEKSLEAKRQINRIIKETSSNDLAVVDLSEKISSDSVKISAIKNCFLLMEEPWTTALVDDQNRIRGYYAPASLEEADRLLVELKILLKKY